MTRIMHFLAISFLLVATAQSEDNAKTQLDAVERMLLGEWHGGACMGELIFSADGKFERHHYSPGNNKLTGTWQLRWDAIPPTLTMTCVTTDAPDRLPVGAISQVKLVQLDNEKLMYQYSDESPARFERSVRGKGTPPPTLDNELMALQGLWIPLQYEEEGGGAVRGEFNFRQIIEGDRVAFQVNGETKAEGKVVVDATQNPKHLDFQFTSGQTDLIIYVRTGDYVIYCGNRDGKTRPTQFTRGTSQGGEYLSVWKIQH